MYQYMYLFANIGFLSCLLGFGVLIIITGFSIIPFIFEIKITPQKLLISFFIVAILLIANYVYLNHAESMRNIANDPCYEWFATKKVFMASIVLLPIAVVIFYFSNSVEMKIGTAIIFVLAIFAFFHAWNSPEFTIKKFFEGHKICEYNEIYQQ